MRSTPFHSMGTCMCVPLTFPWRYASCWAGTGSRARCYLSHDFSRPTQTKRKTNIGRAEPVRNYSPFLSLRASDRGRPGSGTSCAVPKRAKPSSSSSPLPLLFWCILDLPLASLSLSPPFIPPPGAASASLAAASFRLSSHESQGRRHSSTERQRETRKDFPTRRDRGTQDSIEREREKKRERERANKNQERRAEAQLFPQN